MRRSRRRRKGTGGRDKKFYVPAEVPKHFQETLGKRGAKLHSDWVTLFKEYEKKYPELAAELWMIQKNELPKGWDKDLPTFPADAKGTASRVSGGKAENAIAKNVPWMLGGSADLAPSTKTLIDGETDLGAATIRAGGTCTSGFASMGWSRP